MPKFRKKPVVIEAFRLGHDSIPDWCMDAVTKNRVILHLESGKPPVGGYARIITLEGTMLAESGDWIIRGVVGELYPIKDSIFVETYEAVYA